MVDVLGSLPEKLAQRILLQLSFRRRVRLESVSKVWRELIHSTYPLENGPVWVYVIYRKSQQSGHEKLFVQASHDGPVFWGRLVFYVYCCSCHFTDTHEPQLLGLFSRLSHRVDRLCLVDSPVDYAFLTDRFFAYVSSSFSRLRFVYLRELDLEGLSFSTAQRFAAHPTLQQFVVHQCRRCDVLTDFAALPQLRVIQGEIQGMKQLLAGLDLDGFGNGTAVAAASLQESKGVAVFPAVE